MRKPSLCQVFTLLVTGLALVFGASLASARGGVAQLSCHQTQSVVLREVAPVYHQNVVSQLVAPAYQSQQLALLVDPTFGVARFSDRAAVNYAGVDSLVVEKLVQRDRARLGDRFRQRQADRTQKAADRAQNRANRAAVKAKSAVRVKTVERFTQR